VLPIQSVSEEHGSSQADSLASPHIVDAAGRTKHATQVLGHVCAQVGAGGATRRQAPPWQVPPAQAVPVGLGLHLPFLHRLHGPHFFLHLASAWLHPSRARGPLRVSPPRSRVNPRRVVLFGWAPMSARVKVLNAPLSN
jgi:hypothetical protein